MMNFLEDIKMDGRWLGEEVVTIHKISDFAFIETKNKGGRNFTVFVDGHSIGRGVGSLDHAILMALAYKHSKQTPKDVDAWRYAARVLQMEG